ncbi:MAG: DUF1116 domain-containing protein [Anaerolineae bacterium]|nr:DUF1116 domain-containing protein [Anaerolineae bacterium]
MTPPDYPDFERPLKVISIGLSTFAEGLRQQGASVIEVDWSPPVVPLKTHTSAGVSIEDANHEAVRRMMQSRPMLTGLGLAGGVIPGLGERTILHAGPPITWDRMCGPMRGAVIGALIYEGLADLPQQAEALAAGGQITFAPCHDYHAVGPMAGILSPSMPVWIVENEPFTTYSTLNEGLGRVLRYGAYGDDVYARLHWMVEVLYPVLADALVQHGPLDIRSFVTQALHMGDDCHNRNRAATSLLLRALGPALARTCHDRERLAQVMEFIGENDHFFLNLAMSAAKAMALPAEGIEGATIVTTMSRNGTDFGIRISGDPQRWFTAPSGRIEGLYFSGFSAEDANPDIGDSTITETVGFGAFAMAAAPAIARFVGGTAQDALTATIQMYEICFAEHTQFTIPALEFRGTPVGIDVRLVMETGILPHLNTGIAHKEPGIGMVGAGIVEAPYRCFADAFKAISTW